MVSIVLFILIGIKLNMSTGYFVLIGIKAFIEILDLGTKCYKAGTGIDV